MMETMKSAQPHRTVTVRHGQHVEEIDEAIAPLIRELWMAGFQTMMSCQEIEPGLAWVAFDDVHELERFLSLITVFETGIDAMYNRITRQFSGPMSIPYWDYQLNPIDCGGEADEGPPSRPTDFVFTAGVYIPMTIWWKSRPGWHDTTSDRPLAPPEGRCGECTDARSEIAISVS